MGNFYHPTRRLSRFLSKKVREAQELVEIALYHDPARQSARVNQDRPYGPVVRTLEIARLSLNIPDDVFPDPVAKSDLAHVQRVTALYQEIDPAGPMALGLSLKIGRSAENGAHVDGVRIDIVDFVP